MVTDFSSYVRQDSGGVNVLDLRVEGMKCASCALKVREALTKDGKTEAQIDLTSGQASLRWQGEADQANALARIIVETGYGAQPYSAREKDTPEQAEIMSLARCTIAAGVASAFIMGVSHLMPSQIWAMAGLSFFAVLYAGRPFFASAWRALVHGHVNMDVPISFALVLTTGLGLVEVFHRGTFAYIDSVTMLLFILLIGRYLDQKTRSRAKTAANELLALFSGSATILEGETTRTIPIREIKPGMVLSVAVGDRIAVDGVVTQGTSEVDPSIITGETMSQPVKTGTAVLGGMVNLLAPLHVRAEAASSDSLMAEIVQLIQKAQQGHARFVRLADRVAKIYTPVVFGLFLLAFLGWWLAAGLPWQESLLIATTVLIITCPCAMGLAVPAVQILASTRLFKSGVLVKSADALERLAKVDMIVFDKTGTLTLGKPKLVNRGDITTEELKLAASLAAQSRHPLAQAALKAHGDGPVYALDVSEVAGEGLEADWKGEVIRLGRREWSGPTSFPSDDKMELWLRIGYKPPRRFAFADELRPDALDLANILRKEKYELFLLSGDRETVVSDVAHTLGIEQAHALMRPADKCVFIEELKTRGRQVLMVGDGLNDAAALAAAHVSLSPSSALDITQNAADLVFQGVNLWPVHEALSVSRRAERLVRQNIGLSVLYNVIAVPLALAGLASPLIAAAAMSISSLTVVLNAQRMRHR